MRLVYSDGGYRGLAWRRVPIAGDLTVVEVEGGEEWAVLSDCDDHRIPNLRKLEAEALEERAAPRQTHGAGQSAHRYVRGVVDSFREPYALEPGEATAQQADVTARNDFTPGERDLHQMWAATTQGVHGATREWTSAAVATAPEVQHSQGLVVLRHVQNEKVRR